MSSIDNYSESACERLFKYIANFKESVKSLKLHSQTPEVRTVVDLAFRYLEDSEYYYSRGDCVTGIATISYAEGLLDALKMLNLIDLEWRKRSARVVLAAGSFDVIHPGHVEFLKWASSLGDKLYVVVARDSTYRSLRGRPPVFSENERLTIVSAIRYVYRAMLGFEDDKFRVLDLVKPDVIALGPDQGVEEDKLQREIEKRGLKSTIVRMSSKIGNYSSSLIKSRICSELCGNFRV